MVFRCKIPIIAEEIGTQVEAAGSTFFAMTKQKLSYAEAGAACKSYGAVLATICNEEELLALRWESSAGWESSAMRNMASCMRN